MKREPNEKRITNPGRDDYWTCPACYEDHGNVGDEQVVDCDCGNQFRATLESMPVCVSTLLEDEE